MLKQNTAVTIKFGVFVDDTDGKTPETGLTISQNDIRISKNGGSFAQTHNTAGATHDENGYYNIPLDSTDTNTLGILRVSVSKSGALPVWQDFMVVTANVYDTFCSTASLNVNVASLSTDAITAASLKADAITEIQNGLATAAALSVVDDFVDELESRLTASRAGYLDKLNVAGDLANTSNANSFKADVSGLATASALAAVDDLVDELESRLTAIRAGYLDRLDATVSSRLADADYTDPDNAGITAIKAKTDNLPATPANEATLTAIKGAGWTDETLVALMTAIENISAGSGASAQEVWEYATRTLTNPDDYKADVSGLATTTHLQEVENKVDAVGTSVATPATVWAYPDRTLTVSSIRPRPLVDGDQFTIYKDATINIPITKLGDISVYDNLWFTIKREQDLESADDQSVVHMDLLTGMLYLNKQAAVAAQGSITIVDATTGSINILITKEGAALLPVYAREPLRWEVKGIHGEIVDILLQGSCFIQPAVSRKIS